MREKQRQLLIELRSQLIAKESTLPYCIYTDATIDALLDAQPKSIAELVQVKGFPEKGKRVKGFGEAIVAIFNDTNRIQSFTLKEGSSAEDFEVGTKLKPITAF